MSERGHRNMMETDMSETPTTVWTEIPVRDLDAAIAFYEKVFGWKMKKDESGPNPLAFFSDDMVGIHGHIYPGTPATSGSGPTVHLSVPDTLDAATERLKQGGGTFVSGPVTIPGGSFVYCEDPDGNSIGLFEEKAA